MDRAWWVVGVVALAVVGMGMVWVEGGGAASRPVLGPGERMVEVEISGGHETDERDGGRPVVLVAGALGVPEGVFREVFKGVRPARGRGPTEEEARRNKEVLMRGLAKYGVTNERLDEVSNYYRYRRDRGELWANRPARVEAVVKEGRVVRVEIFDGGAGYSSVPEVRIEGVEGVKLRAVVEYGRDLETNGGIKGIVVEGEKGTAG